MKLGAYTGVSYIFGAQFAGRHARRLQETAVDFLRPLLTNPSFELADIDALGRRQSKFFAGERFRTPEEYLIRPVANIKPKFKGGIVRGARSSS